MVYRKMSYLALTLPVRHVYLMKTDIHVYQRLVHTVIQIYRMGLYTAFGEDCQTDIGKSPMNQNIFYIFKTVNLALFPPFSWPSHQ